MSAYCEQRHLPYSAAQLFDLVADVERYPDFMPWVIEATIRRRLDHTLYVGMTVGVGPIRKRFASIGSLHRPDWIDIRSSDPLFARFEQQWIFESAAAGGSNVEYRVEFEFRSRVLHALMAASLARQAAATVSAFEQRAARIYGTPPQANFGAL
jgi:coenzyme Q-binding protein COQ10